MSVQNTPFDQIKSFLSGLVEKYKDNVDAKYALNMILGFFLCSRETQEGDYAFLFFEDDGFDPDDQEHWGRYDAFAIELRKRELHFYKYFRAHDDWNDVSEYEALRYSGGLDSDSDNDIAEMLDGEGGWPLIEFQVVDADQRVHKCRATEAEPFTFCQGCTDNGEELVLNCEYFFRNANYARHKLNLAALVYFIDHDNRKKVRLDFAFGDYLATIEDKIYDKDEEPPFDVGQVMDGVRRMRRSERWLFLDRMMVMQEDGFGDEKILEWKPIDLMFAAACCLPYRISTSFEFFPDDVINEIKHYREGVLSDVLMHYEEHDAKWDDER